MFNKAVESFLRETIANKKYETLIPENSEDMVDIFMILMNKPVRDVMSNIATGKLDMNKLFKTLIGLLQAAKQDLQYRHAEESKLLAKNSCRDSHGELFPDTAHREASTVEEKLQHERAGQRLKKRLSKIGHLLHEAEKLEKDYEELKAMPESDESTMQKADVIIYGVSLLFHPDLVIDNVLRMLEPAVKAAMMTAIRPMLDASDAENNGLNTLSSAIDSAMNSKKSTMRASIKFLSGSKKTTMKAQTKFLSKKTQGPPDTTSAEFQAELDSLRAACWSSVGKIVSKDEACVLAKEAKAQGLSSDKDKATWNSYQNICDPTVLYKTLQEREQAVWIAGGGKQWQFCNDLNVGCLQEAKGAPCAATYYYGEMESLGPSPGDCGGSLYGSESMPCQICCPKGSVDRAQMNRKLAV